MFRISAAVKRSLQSGLVGIMRPMRWPTNRPKVYDRDDIDATVLTIVVALVISHTVTILS